MHTRPHARTHALTHARRYARLHAHRMHTGVSCTEVCEQQHRLGGHQALPVATPWINGAIAGTFDGTFGGTFDGTFGEHSMEHSVNIRWNIRWQHPGLMVQYQIRYFRMVPTACDDGFANSGSWIDVVQCSLSLALLTTWAIRHRPSAIRHRS